MKFLKVAPLAVFMALAACTPEMEVASSAPPKQAPTVIDPLIGKRLVTENGTLIMNANGTIGGEIRGEPVVGTYKATATESCSTFTAPDLVKGREFCSVPAITGKTVIFTRRDGSKSPVYTIEG